MLDSVLLEFAVVKFHLKWIWTGFERHPRSFCDAQRQWPVAAVLRNSNVGQIPNKYKYEKIKYQASQPELWPPDSDWFWHPKSSAQQHSANISLECTHCIPWKSKLALSLWLWHNYMWSWFRRFAQKIAKMSDKPLWDRLDALRWLLRNTRPEFWAPCDSLDTVQWKTAAPCVGLLLLRDNRQLDRD